MNEQLAGIQDIEGTYIFDVTKSVKALRLNRFFWRHREPEFRELVERDFLAVANEMKLTEEERALIERLDWLGLIQYVGDNVGGNRFLSFSHSILTQITDLHPYFSRPYEIDLIFAPLSSGENTTLHEKVANKQIAVNVINLGKK